MDKYCYDQRLLNKPVSQLFFRYTAEAERQNQVKTQKQTRESSNRKKKK